MSARVHVAGRPRRAGLPPPDPADDRRPARRHGHRRGDVVRAPLHRAPPVPGRGDHRFRQAQALRPEADDRQPGLPAGRPRRRAAPRRAHRARLPADRRADRGPSPDRDARGAGPRRRPLPGIPSRVDPHGCGRGRHRGAPWRRRTTRRRSRVGTARCAGSRSTSCWRSSSAWSGGGGSGDGTRPSRGGRCRGATPRCVRRRSRPSAARPAPRSTLTRRPGHRDGHDPRRPAAADPMLRLLQGDVGSGKTAVAAWALARRGAGRTAGRPAGADRPPRAPARTRPSPTSLEDVGHRRRAADRARSRAATAGARPGGHRELGPGAGRRRDPRAAPGARSRSRDLAARGHRRAAPLRRRAARPARGEGRRAAHRTSC